VSLGAEILDSWSPVLSGVELKTGDKGRFEVLLDGEEIFSKAKLGRFPAEKEVTRLLEPRLGPAPGWRSKHK
jgi:selT/selW/selH-like putative selenoprotein